ncbi:type II toxin-antitoxin system HicB family antitoxin [Pseudolactococcus raffinolactis]|uniref:type II toxin-antitoxin system HicB family antitoxin n=1 Tax=Pseudolactococcus raffinolactis TaxID=1366 RepID=UPI0014369A67|nr:type II toxin-antitoxin system HicB family antitoxin [Lactococcus raffinolactis]QIW51226.1 type II toxin-antitoxin system HicB family antitoxin [Lactococcus raffinolactis]
MSHSIAFPTVISFDDQEKSDYKYLVYIPDLDGYTQGVSLADAIVMARDYIGTFSLDNPLPEPGKVSFKAEDSDVVTLVDIDPDKYRRELDKTPVKKTLTIPSYLNDAAINEGINFSQTLADAIKDKLHLA